MTKFITKMNSKNDDSTMKKIFMMICAAAAVLAGCQNVEDLNEGVLGGKDFKATVSTPDLSRTELVYADGAYKAQWCEGDQVALIEVATVDAENATITKYESNALTAAAESAEFSFKLPEVTAEKYQYVLAYPYGNVGIADATAVNLTLATSQVKKDSSFGANCDLLIAKSEELAAQPESMAFTLTRLSAVAKMTLKNFAIPAGEIVEDVTFSCEQTLTGTIGVNYADLSWSVVRGTNSVTTTNYEWTVTADGTLDVYFSVLPTTLKAGESYTITVETDKANYHKTANFASDLRFQAGDITSFSASMQDAGVNTKSTVDLFDDDFDYVIAFKDLNNTTYLLKRGECERRPVPTEISTLGLSINSKGALVGEVPADYRWSASARTDENGVVWGKFSYKESNVDYYLINTYYAQGVGISKVYATDPDGNDDGFNGVDGRGPYIDEIRIATKGDGYRLFSAGSGEDYNLCVYSGAQFRLLPTAEGQANASLDGTVYFYRVNNTSVQKSVYPVITDATHVTEGTYVIMHNINGVYNALKNDVKTDQATAVGSENVSLTIENGVVATAEIGDEYKWVITKSNHNGYFQIRSWTMSNLWVWHRNNSKGVAVCDTDTATGYHTSHWRFVNDPTWGMQMNGLDDNNSEHNRYARVVDNATWGTLGSPTGEIVLIKLSSSTTFTTQN